MNIIILISENTIDESNVKNSINVSITQKKVRKIQNLNAVYLYLNEKLSIIELNEVREYLRNERIDVIQVENLLDKNEESLFVFDMDSTLIKQEIIDELAKSVNVYEAVSIITEEAMQGKLDFETSLKNRCELLKGADEKQFEILYNKIELNFGVKEFLELSNNFRIRKVVLSGGFNPILKKFISEYQFDDYRANTLETIHGKFSGKLIGEIIDKNKKAYYLNYYKNKFNINHKQTVAVGDGSNDILMIQNAGIGVGFHPKDGLKKEIMNWVRFSGLYFLLFLYE